jgi:uncharacterized protein YjiS (DUF1127 family)
MEVAMTSTVASTPHQPVRPQTSVRAISRRDLTSPRSMIVAWRERIRFRWSLGQMSEANPHLIDDIGLTKRQVEAEIAKPFWRA